VVVSVQQPATAAAVRAALAALPQLAPLLPSCRLAVARAFLDFADEASAAVQAGDEVALIPPVSGG